MAIYFEPYLQRKRSEEIATERYYDQKQIAEQNLREDVAGAANIIFAYGERHKQEMQEKFKTLTTIGGVMGWDKMPQSALDSYGNSVDAMAGQRIYPRGPDGHAIAPPPSTDQMTQQYLMSLPPEERKKRLDVLSGFSKPNDPYAAAKDARLAAKDQRDEAHDKVMESLRAREVANKERPPEPKGKQASSGLVMDQNSGQPRPAQEGEIPLTYGQLDAMTNSVKRKNVDARENERLNLEKERVHAEKAKLWHDIHHDKDTTTQMAHQTMATALSMMKSKDEGTQKAGAIMLRDGFNMYAQSKGAQFVHKDQIEAELTPKKGETYSQMAERWLASMQETLSRQGKGSAATAADPNSPYPNEDAFLRSKGF